MIEGQATVGPHLPWHGVENRAGTQPQIDEAVLRLDAWLDTMRGPDGYGGPVAHWWQDCLLFTGTGLDWRYEGLILGYLNLYGKTGEGRWLAKARRAGHDLVRGQLPTGNFRASCFEANPYPGGTPHEAACARALLGLARELKETGDPAWRTYSTTAEKNLRWFVIGRLWDGEARMFRNTASDPAFVPNKVATIVEALFAWADLSGDDAPVERYAGAALEAIVRCQVRAPGDPLEGGIPQRVDGRQADGRYFPYYVARCVPGLVAGYEWAGEERYLDAARRAMAFVLRWRYEDGSFPQVVYPGGHLNRYPQWVAGTGDILRAMELLRPYGLEADVALTLDWLLRGQAPNGSFRTARGFASQISQRPPGPVPEFRDLLGVAGWTDKAFHYLTDVLPPGGIGPGSVSVAPAWEAECTFRGHRMLLVEDGEGVELHRNGRLCYRWRKGAPWAEVQVWQLL